MRRRWDPSIRTRVTIWAAVVSTVLVSGILAAVLVLVRTDEVNDTFGALGVAARRVVERAEAGELETRLYSDELIQVVDLDGVVQAATPGMVDRKVVDFIQPRVIDAYQDGRSCEVDAPGGPCFQVVAMRAASAPDGPLIVYTMEPEPGLLPRPLFAWAIVLGGLSVVALTGYATWRGAGRTLRRVERIRTELDEITATDLQRRVTSPPRRDEVARLADSVNATLDRLEGAVARLRGFVSDVSHELRSPLTGLRMELELALSDPDDTDLRTTLRALLLNAERLHAVLDDLLVIARLDSGQRFEPEPVDLQALADQEVLRRPRRARISVQAGEPVVVHGGRSELGRLLTNLIDNADRHAASKVNVIVRQEGGTAVVEVDDDGAGIAPEDRERVFERFTRLDEGRHRDAGGTGLGLAISRDIAAAHGGTLVLDDPQDGSPGACFVLRLPMTARR